MKKSKESLKGEREPELELAPPSVAVKDSYLAAIKEFQAEGRWMDKDAQGISKDFEGYVEKILAHAKGVNLPAGYVPDTELWLKDQDRFIGTIRIRHELTAALKEFGGHIGYEVRPTERKKGYATKMLGLGLQKAKELGLKEVLITCDETNTASRKVIEANGGVFQGTSLVDAHSVPTRRYVVRF